MANSVQQSPGGAVWPLGYVNVTTPGTKVCLMVNVDANNVNAPGATNIGTFPGAGREFSQACRGLGVQTWKPGNNTIAAVPNTGQIYLLVPPSGNNTGNKSDTGCIWKVLPPGQDFFIPEMPISNDMMSPYFLYLDADNANDGAFVTLYGGSNP